MTNFTLYTTGLLFAGALLTASVDAADWPQWRGPERDGVWRVEGIVEELPQQLTFAWRTNIGEGYAGPAVAGGRVFVPDRVVKPDAPGGHERVLCLDEATGKVLWKHEYPCRYEISYPHGPRATPTIDGDRVYSVGAMGDFFCLSVSSGKVLWAKDFVDDYGMQPNTWGMASAPLVDGERLILVAGGRDGSTLVCLNKLDGEHVWKALDVKDPGYSSPLIIEAGGRRQLVLWTPDGIHSFDPRTGDRHWTQPFPVEAALSVATPVFEPENRRLFVSSFYNGTLMLGLDANQPKCSVLWRGKSSSEKETDGLHALMCTPFVEEGYIYGICSYGQLRCIEAGTGRRVWETLEATGHGRWWNAFLVRHGSRTIVCNEQGELIFARLSPDGYEETSRAQLIEPTRKVQRRMTIWSHPAFAGTRVYARNDKEIVCAELAKPAK